MRGFLRTHARRCNQLDCRRGHGMGELDYSLDGRRRLTSQAEIPHRASASRSRGLQTDSLAGPVRRNSGSPLVLVDFPLEAVLAGNGGQAHDAHDEKQDKEDNPDNQDWHTNTPRVR